MIWLNWVSGLVSLLCMAAIVIYLSYFGPNKNWGDVSQAIMFHQVNPEKKKKKEQKTKCAERTPLFYLLLLICFKNTVAFFVYCLIIESYCSCY